MNKQSKLKTKICASYRYQILEKFQHMTKEQFKKYSKERLYFIMKGFAVSLFTLQNAYRNALIDCRIIERRYNLLKEKYDSLKKTRPVKSFTISKKKWSDKRKHNAKSKI